MSRYELKWTVLRTLYKDARKNLRLVINNLIVDIDFSCICSNQEVDLERKKTRRLFFHIFFSLIYYFGIPYFIFS